MPQLRIEFHHGNSIPAELSRRIDALDHLAFSDQPQNDPEMKNIIWATPDWMVLGFLEHELVSQFCLHQREITVGEESIPVAGVGGVATHPDWQKRGFASQLLRASVDFLQIKMKAVFGLLVCDDQIQPVYARCGWRTVARSLVFIQDQQLRSLPACVMILELTNRPWPSGEINLCGAPW